MIVSRFFWGIGWIIAGYSILNSSYFFVKLIADAVLIVGFILVISGLFSRNERRSQ